MMSKNKYLISIFLLVSFFVVANFFVKDIKAAAPSEQDAIAIRVLPNPNHYSVLRWYNEQGFTGSPQVLTVDGYEAIRDGRSVYVGAVNVDGNNVYTNIYLISHSQNIEKATVDIFGQILSHWKFNTNINKVGFCASRNDKTSYQGSSDCFNLAGNYKDLGGNFWEAKESIREWKGIDISYDGKIQTAVARNGQIYTSYDYGNTWEGRGPVKVWRNVALSDNGAVQLAAANGDQLYVSTDYGNTWTAKESSRAWFGVAVSADGKIQTATAMNDKIYISTDYGNTWTVKNSDRLWRDVAMSSDGKIQTAVVYNGFIYISTDYGNTWTEKEESRSWDFVAMSSDGKTQMAGELFDGKIYVSIDYGNTWTGNGVDKRWRGVAMSDDGRVQAAVSTGIDLGRIYVSFDYGKNWTAKDYDRNWFGVAVSGDGKVQAATAINDKIYVSYGSRDSFCVMDSDCASTSYCKSIKSGLVRDTRRLSDLKYIQTFLKLYKEKNGHYPVLSSGSYLSNKTISVWPSWKDAFGKELEIVMPIDPLNSLGACDGYNSITCWDEKSQEFYKTGDGSFVLPPNSHAYVYTTNSSGSNYSLYGVGEVCSDNISFSLSGQ